MHGFMKHAAAGGTPDILPVFLDEAGHRVATEYLMAALEGELPVEKLYHYREYLSHLPGHPERGVTPGVKFSCRIMWTFMAVRQRCCDREPGQSRVYARFGRIAVEGDDSEAARLAVSRI